jgi:hypothetical protein
MKAEGKSGLGRRQFFRALGAGAAAAAVVPLATNAEAAGENKDERRKARYQANAAEVQTFYRVNRYPTKS